MSEAASVPPTSRPFVGRTRELATLLAHVTASAAGDGRVVLVTGEPGIGKTRLVEEALAAVPSARVCWGRCYDTEGTPAFWPWIQALRRYAGSAPPDRLEAELGADAAEIARILPQVRSTAAPSGEPPPAGDPDEARFRLFDATAGFLRRVAEPGPFVIALDDLHWADSETLMMLSFVAREIRGSRLLVIGTLRDAEMRQTTAVRRALADLTRVCARVPLAGLDVDDVAAFVTAAGGAPPALVEAVHRRTDGNPFFVSEVVQLLRDEGRLTAPAVDGAADFRMPAGVLDVVRRRTDPLPPDTLELLATAAIVGREFDVAVVGLAAGRPTAEVLESLAPARDLRLVAETAHHVGVLRFAHALVRDALVLDLAPGRRADLHRRVGEAIERHVGPTADRYLGELANHFFQAASLGGAEKAIDYATRAGRLAKGRLGFEEAAGHFERALRVARIAGLPADERWNLLVQFGELQRLACDEEGARATFIEAAQLAREQGNARRYALGAVLCASSRAETGGVDVTVINLLDDALRAMGEHPDPSTDDLRSAALGLLARALYFTPEAERREAVSAEAVAIARRASASSGALAAALASRHMALWGPGRVEERLAIVSEALDAATTAKRWDLVSETHIWRIHDLFELGDIAGVDREVGRLEQVAVGFRVVRAQWLIALVRAARALMAGRLEDAEALAHRAAGIRVATPLNNVEQFHAVQIFLIREEQGRLAELEPALALVGERARTLPIWRTAEAMVHLACGRPEAARRILVDLAARDFTDLSRDGTWVATVCRLAELCVRLGELDLAAILLPLLEPYASYWAVMGLATACQGAVTRYLGILAMLTGDVPRAVAELERAVESNRRGGAVIQLGYALGELATALRARAREGDAARADALVSEASATAERLGLVALQAQLGAPPSPVAVAPRPSAVSLTASMRREGDFWTIACGDEMTRLRDTKGILYLVDLLRHPGREFHALDMVGMEAGQAGDSGEILDTQARAAYKQRLRELGEELAEAEEFNDPGRVGRVREEIEVLTNELARGVGLGGRARRAGSDAERARLNVTRAVRAVIKKIVADCPRLGRHLETAVQTGAFCSYEPDPVFPVTWNT